MLHSVEQMTLGAGLPVLSTYNAYLHHEYCTGRGLGRLHSLIAIQDAIHMDAKE